MPARVPAHAGVTPTPPNGPRPVPVNVTLPSALRDAARAHGLPLSALLEEAVRDELAMRGHDVPATPPRQPGPDWRRRRPAR